MTNTEPTRTDADVQLVDDDRPAPPGRPVRLVPTPPGFWGVLGGAIVAVLAPFFGILIGSTRGSEEVSSRMDPIYWGFAIGCIIGALGMVAVLLGARRLWLDARARKQEERA
ncbi:hypothetical protein [Ornithinimicrobium sufpigmenti]|uniref:hypothetical protein n=1 Tax=Ornithinimicrobium sufpigmenti TaxID=2508882 RepID=UPI001036D318|nr:MULTISPECIES: hypothetical protein [unclassified Ornithinimicrobium]